MKKQTISKKTSVSSPKIKKSRKPICTSDLLDVEIYKPRNSVGASANLAEFFEQLASEECTKNPCRSSDYNEWCSIVIPGATVEGVKIEIWFSARRAKDDRFLRLKYNPSKAGEDGNLWVQKFLDKVFGYERSEVMEHAYIKAWHPAVDLPYALDDLFMLPSRVSTFTVFRKTMSKRKGYESIYLGSQSSSSNMVAYSHEAASLDALCIQEARRVAEEVIPKLKPINFADGEGLPPEVRKAIRKSVEMNIRHDFELLPPTTRVEIRFNKLSFRVGNLSQAGNVFKNLRIMRFSDLSEIHRSKDQETWALFVELYQYAGTPEALSKLSEATQERFKYAIDKLENIWHAEEYWQKCLDHVQSLPMFD